MRAVLTTAEMELGAEPAAHSGPSDPCPVDAPTTDYHQQVLRRGAGVLPRRLSGDDVVTAACMDDWRRVGDDAEEAAAADERWTAAAGDDAAEMASRRAPEVS